MKFSLSTCLAVLLSFSGCTSPDKPTSSRRIIDRSPGHEETPAWVRGKKRTTEGDRVVFLGHLSMDAKANATNCTHSAGTEAKGRLASLMISSVLDEAGIAGDERSTLSNRMTAVLSKTRIVGAEIDQEFYELVEIDDGELPARKLECFAQVSIPKKVFDDLLDKSIAEITDKQMRQKLEVTQEKMREEEQKK